jgi:hypothetical protein
MVHGELSNLVSVGGVGSYLSPSPSSCGWSGAWNKTHRSRQSDRCGSNNAIHRNISHIDINSSSNVNSNNSHHYHHHCSG